VKASAAVRNFVERIVSGRGPGCGHRTADNCHDDPVVIDYIPSAKAQSAPASDDLCVPVVDDLAVLLLADAGGWRLPTVGAVTGGGVGRALGAAPSAGVVSAGAASAGAASAGAASAGAFLDSLDIAPIGTMRGRAVWAAAIPATNAALDVPAGLVLVDWLACAAQPDAGLTSVVARAVAVMTWRRTHRFCGACRTELAEVEGAVGRACPSCGSVTFAKAQPVALVAVWRRGASGAREVLLARHTYGAKHLWALVGGYVDPAESLEQAAHREVAEEVGLRVTELRYFGSEAWGLNGPGVLLAAYTARSVDPDADAVVDGHELAEAHFFPVDALPDPIPPAQLIAGRALSHLATLPYG
jgi:NAD+ diphosphatase